MFIVGKIANDFNFHRKTLDNLFTRTITLIGTTKPILQLPRYSFH